MLTDNHLENADLATLVAFIVLPGEHPRAEDSLFKRFTRDMVLTHYAGVTDLATRVRLAEFLNRYPERSERWLPAVAVREG